MKMGAIASPWRYDWLTGIAIGYLDIRRRSEIRYSRRVSVAGLGKPRTEFGAGRRRRLPPDGSVVDVACSPLYDAFMHSLSNARYEVRVPA
jgi:hypothetical protein